MSFYTVVLIFAFVLYLGLCYYFPVLFMVRRDYRGRGPHLVRRAALISIAFAYIVILIRWYL